MKGGLTLNGEKYGRLYESKIHTEAGGVDFYEGESSDSGEVEARSWIDCIINDTEPVVKPEEALVVTEILEAIYESSRIGKPVFLKESK